jgi:hypothetical protein
MWNLTRSPLKQCPSAHALLFECSCYSMGHIWKCSIRIAVRLAVTFCRISSAEKNNGFTAESWVSRKPRSSMERLKWLGEGGRRGEEGGIEIPFFTKNCRTARDAWQWPFSWSRSPDSIVSPVYWPLIPNDISQTLGHKSEIYSSAWSGAPLPTCRQKVICVTCWGFVVRSLPADIFCAVSRTDIFLRIVGKDLVTVF